MGQMTVNSATTTAARMPATTAHDVSDDRILAATYPTLERRLDEAIARVQSWQANPVDAAQGVIAADRVLTAYDNLIAAAEAAYRVAVGPTRHRARSRIIKGRYSPAARAWLATLERLRIARQDEIMRQPLSLRVPTTVRVGSTQAWGPAIAGMTSDTQAPMDPQITRSYGLDPVTVLQDGALAKAS